MKKVLIIMTTGFELGKGITLVVMNYYRAMDKSGLQLDFAADNGVSKLLIGELDRDGGQYIKLPDRKRHTLKYMKKLYKLLKNGGYDVIHVHGNSATMAVDLFPAWLLKVKRRIAHVHTTKNQHAVLHWLLKPAMNHFLTDRIAVSEEAGYYLYGRKPFEILNNAIDVEHYQYDFTERVKCRERWEIPELAFVVGTVGRMNLQKNHLYLIELFAKVLVKRSNAILLIVGDGELRGKIEEKIHMLGIEDSCVLTGMQEDTAPFLSAMDVFVFPSVFEGFGMAMLEAQACGLSCYYTDVLPQRVVVTENCRGLNLENVDEWVEEISNGIEYDRVQTSQTGIEKLMENGFYIQNVANDLRRLYE